MFMHNTLALMYNDDQKMTKAYSLNLNLSCWSLSMLKAMSVGAKEH